MAQVHKARIMVFDPSPMNRLGIFSLLSASGYEFVTSLPTLSEAIQDVCGASPDLLILGSNFDQLTSLAQCRAAKAIWSAVNIIVLMGNADDPLLQVDCAFLDISACLPSDISEDDYLISVAAVLAGHRLFPPEIISTNSQPIALTRREAEVLTLLAKGQTDQQIAKSLGLRFATVRNHSQRILEKLSVHSRHEAVRRAQRLGWIAS